jgi:hypothetical protein
MVQNFFRQFKLIDLRQRPGQAGMRLEFREIGSNLPHMVADPSPTERLGHGDHWAAVGIKDIASFIESGLPQSSVVGEFAPPWPKSPCKELVITERLYGLLNVNFVLGRNSPKGSWRVLSAYPNMKCYEEWVIRVDGVNNAYGAVEGCVEATASAEHSFNWFAPYFGIEARGWRLAEFLRVHLSALALKLAPYAAEPIIVTEGPLIEERRKELRAEGKIAQSKRKDLKLTVSTDQLRTLYSSFHDHHAFVGKVVGKRIIKPIPEFQGYILDVEVMPDPLVTGWKIPMYVFPNVLGDYEPKRGDLIQGTAWLQGGWVRVAKPTEETAWRNQSCPKE